MTPEYAFYAQSGEDFLLWHLFDRRARGFYVDIGAFDGVYLSNSYFFERWGWTGICIEPHPVYFEYCRKQRPESICLNLACVGDPTVEKVAFGAEKIGLFSGIQADYAEAARDSYGQLGLNFDGFDTVAISAATLNQVLKEHLPSGTPLDFVSIDVEGRELDVLRGFDIGQYHPRIILTEANTEAYHDQLCDYLVQGHGYHEARRVAQNIFFARDHDDVPRLRSIRLRCRRALSQHPLGPEFTILVGDIIHQSAWTQTLPGRIARRLLRKWRDRQKIAASFDADGGRL